ncbi:hypothetical protein [uncultured Alsobacter sp.]|uniref:hypothetical protein n=1 Tax=uncultured Alsobacter sp. TaxID=1748258 RepID=UPI0025DE906B|nr:hypothetical protein [uncultured Alsobacter sp.]
MIRPAVLAFILVAGPALAHSWYPLECCSGTDCEMLSVRQMTRDETSWILPNGQKVPFEQARQSQDDEFHWCRHDKRPQTQIIAPGALRPCFFAPRGGV